MLLNNLHDLGILKEEFISIEKEFNKFAPKDKTYDALKFYDQLGNELSIRGKEDFTSFICEQSEIASDQLKKYFGDTDVAYFCGIDFRIYTLLKKYLNYESLKLTDLLINNLYLNDLITNYENRINITSSFLSISDFQKQEIERIDKMYLSPISVKPIGKNTEIIASFSADSYQRYVYDLLMRGEDREIIGLLRNAKMNYLIAFENSYLPSDLSESILTYITRGAAYVKYYQFLKEKITQTNNIDPLEYELRQSIDTAIRWDIETVKRLRSQKLPFSIFTEFCNKARSLYILFEQNFEYHLNRGVSTHFGIAKKDKYFPMIFLYEKWYQENNSLLKKDFQESNPYSIIYTITQDVKRKMLLHFPESDRNNEIQTSSIFKNPEHSENLKKMLIDMEVIDQYGKSKLTQRKGYILFAIIDSFRTSALLKKVYPDEELLQFFNQEIGTNYKRLKRDAKNFKEHIATAKKYITKYF